MSAEVEPLMRALFAEDWSIERSGNVIKGRSSLGGREIALIGTIAQTEIGVDEALALARAALDIMAVDENVFSPRDILLIVDNAGQRLSKRDELLGNAGYLAHLAKTLHLARRHGHRVLGLVYTLALSGGFMATGMATTHCVAMADAEVRVMRLDAMARITRISRARLEELVVLSPIFGPGVANYYAIGALESLWETPTPEALEAAFDAIRAGVGDRRSALGAKRGGRKMAFDVAETVRRA